MISTNQADHKLQAHCPTAALPHIIAGDASRARLLFPGCRFLVLRVPCTARPSGAGFHRFTKGEREDRLVHSRGGHTFLMRRRLMILTATRSPNFSPSSTRMPSRTCPNAPMRDHRDTTAQVRGRKASTDESTEASTDVLSTCFSTDETHVLIPFMPRCALQYPTARSCHRRFPIGHAAGHGRWGQAF